MFPTLRSVRVPSFIYSAHANKLRSACALQTLEAALRQLSTKTMKDLKAVNDNSREQFAIQCFQPAKLVN